jgi:hypothetical protein
MQAIITKFLSATNSKPSRIKATASAGTITIAYDHDFDCEGAHMKAAEALRAKLGWQGKLIAGGTETGYVFVFEPIAVEKMRDALGNLCQWAVGNRAGKDGNPYMVPEMMDALKALHFDEHGKHDGTMPYGAADKWNKSK